MSSPLLKSILHKPHSIWRNRMNEQTKLELLKISAQLTTVKFKDGDDLEQVFKDCFALAERCLRQCGKTKPIQSEQTPALLASLEVASVQFEDIEQLQKV